MRRYFLAVVFIQIFLMSCGQIPNINQLSSKEFKELIEDKEAILLDVRTNFEFENEHLINAEQLNYYAIDFRRKILLLPKDQDIFLYCNTGYRSEKATEILLENGYTKVYNLQHGIMEWNINNFPVTKEPNARLDKINKYEPEQYQSLLNSDSLIFIDFYAPWCAPCMKMMPMIDSLKLEYHNRIKIVKINSDASKKLIKKLQIVSVPYLVFYHKGEVIFSKNGMISKQDLIAIFDSNLKNSYCKY